LLSILTWQTLNNMAENQIQLPKPEDTKEYQYYIQKKQKELEANSQPASSLVIEIDSDKNDLDCFVILSLS